MAISIETEHVQYTIAANATHQHFIDKRMGRDYCAQNTPFARVRIGREEISATSAASADGQITVQFGSSGVTVVLSVVADAHSFTLEVVSVTGASVEELVFVDLALVASEEGEEAFAGCALALNLQTNVPELPGANSRLRAMCYPQFGFEGAKVALIGCPHNQLRQVLQEVVQGADALPHSSVGGPWALDAPKNRGSYLFNFGDLSESKVDDWIQLAQSLGVNQIDFHGGNSFRFGDCLPNPKTYPDGLTSLRAVTDRLHGAGILAGLHTYAFFIDKRCPWVTPIPDPRLAKDATFTLTSTLTADTDCVPVSESTQEMSTTTGFFVRNSVTLQIDDELIIYRGIDKQSPYAFTECERGAYGTQATTHAQGTPVHHLKECFGLFVPDGDSTLFGEVAAKTAEAFNEGGFDMIYLDALDGEDIVGGPENGWHYGSKFVFEIWKRLKKPAMMEMSTFHHHLWYVRARMGAWDHPTRSHKRFIDVHVAANESCRRMFLPDHLGWWAFKTWTGPQGEPTFEDDIEYLCGKCLGGDTGLSIMGINPDNVSDIPVLPRLAAVMKRYENLRHSSYFSESVKARLRVPGDEFTLCQNAEGGWQFRPAQYTKHKVMGLDAHTDVWQVRNRFGAQPLRLRIEALMSAGSYSDPGNITLAHFSESGEFPDREVGPGITAALEPSVAELRLGHTSGCYTATNESEQRQGTWAKMSKSFSPPLNLSEYQAMGVWIHGDGQGQVLNFQLRSPDHISHAIGEHYVPVDFTGWRYFELIEPEGERYAEFSWPYGNMYSIYRESVNHGQVATLSLWYNHLPPNGQVTCYLSTVKALPLVKTVLRHPTVTIADKTVCFPVDLESGSYLEFTSMSDCKLYGPKGEQVAEVTPQGDAPSLEPGGNRVEFSCTKASAASARARVTIMAYGEPLTDSGA